jgi:peptidoglycan/xylan/chitin deacetylase (PgdA/CDA1 family)
MFIRGDRMTTLACDVAPNAAAAGLILSYHRIAPIRPDPWGLCVTAELFAEQMATLREIAEPVTLCDLAAGRTGREGRPAVVVTFDDGYVDNLSTALPQLLAHRIPATIFVATGYTGRRHFWWEVLEHVFLSPGPLPARLAIRGGGRSFAWETGEAADYTEFQHAADCRHFRWGGEPGSRIRLYFDVHDALWSFPVEARMDLAGDILAWSGLAPEGLEPARPMTAEEVAELAGCDLVAIGGHTVNHPALDSLSPACQRSEILGGRGFLEELTGRPVDTFAYPHGRHTADSIEALRRGGFAAACTTREAAVQPKCDPLLLPRMVVKNWNAAEFAARLNARLTA